ncbi:ubiquitin-like protein Pup [Nocardiopsis sp. CNR-923]|uniref:ubiquitin-like protein Pup n=1 Tax=Nocardiopsis sp. CNR-923 TaxID=1904965 RepID=UPI000967399E|nr:ubiquitin-like protein Pup [Nocardiopsis sp. CNR-923]OLT29266.1 ubiquitin-like protein Pup [Nocardiopsis sp. CNR-923]
MATKDTGGHKHASRRDTEVEETEATTDVQDTKDRLDEEVDDILDEIDDVLESNAEDFVRQFVQKGGQ